MLRRRPDSARNAGVVACLTALGALAAGCSAGEVEVDRPLLDGADAVACARLLDGLPDSVADQPRRPVTPEDAYAAAWGDPPIVLRCGVPPPAGFDRFATCTETNGVGWFVPEEQITSGAEEVVMTTIGRAQNVEVRLPASYLPPATAMVDLADAIKRTIREVQPCV